MPIYKTVQQCNTLSNTGSHAVCSVPHYLAAGIALGRSSAASVSIKKNKELSYLRERLRRGGARIERRTSNTIRVTTIKTSAPCPEKACSALARNNTSNRAKLLFSPVHSFLKTIGQQIRFTNIFARPFFSDISPCPLFALLAISSCCLP